jgi:hypothetical protein
MKSNSQSGVYVTPEASGFASHAVSPRVVPSAQTANVGRCMAVLPTNSGLRVIYPPIIGAKKWSVHCGSSHGRLTCLMPSDFEYTVFRTASNKVFVVVTKGLRS